MAIVLWCPFEDLKAIPLTLKLTWLFSCGVQLKIEGYIIDSQIDMAVVLWCPVEDLKAIPLILKLTWLLSCNVPLKI